MLLKWSSAFHAERSETETDQIKEDTKVEIRFSYNTSSGRKDLCLPATVQWTGDDGFGVAFDSYDNTISEFITQQSTSTDNNHLSAPLNETNDSLVSDQPSKLPYVAFAKIRQLERRILILGVPTLFFCLMLLISFGIYIFNIQTQLAEFEATLEQTMERLNSMDLSSIPINSDMQSSIDAISSRLAQVEENLAKIEQTPISHEHVVSGTSAEQSEIKAAPVEPDQLTDAPAPEALSKGSDQNQAVTDEASETQPENDAITAAPQSHPVVETITKEAELTASSGGLWSINLITLRNKDSIQQLADKATSQGIPTTITTIKIKDQTLYQLKVTGFKSSADAKSYANVAEAKLGLKNSWISRMD